MNTEQTKKKTPIGDLIESYQMKLSSVTKMITEVESDDRIANVERLKEKAGLYRSTILDLERALPAERLTIEEAYDKGLEDGRISYRDCDDPFFTDAKNYFNESYEV